MLRQKIASAVISAAIMISPVSVLADETDPSVQVTNASQQSFETIYGSQLMSFLNHQYYFEGSPIPVYETNFYFINAFLDLSQYAYYGYYPSTTEGFIDLSSAYMSDDFATFGDYYVSYAENIVESTYIICRRAEEQGLTLSDDTYAKIDQMIANMSPDKTGMELNDYLELYYGPGMDETAFRDTLSRYYLADLYSTNFCDNYDYADEDRYVPQVRYALFYAPEGSDDSIMQAQEEAANALLDSCTSLDDLQAKAAELSSQGAVYDANDILVSGDRIDPDFKAWATDSARTEGEMAVVKSSRYGYFVMGFMGIVEQDQSVLDNIALADLSQGISAEIQAGTYEFYTNDAYQPAAAVGDPNVPAATLPSVSESTDQGPATAEKGGLTAPLIVTILAIVGGVSIVALVVILIASFVSANKKQTDKNNKEPEDTTEDFQE